SKLKNLYRLHVGVDAIVLDAYSLSVFFKELSYLYSAQSLILSPLKYSIKDYIWQINNDKKTETYRRAKRYWLNRLANFPLAPELPLRTDPSKVGTTTFNRLEHKFSKTEWNNFKLNCSKNQTTASIVMLAAYAKILQLWSSSSRFSINLTLFKRRPIHPDVERLMGDFTSIGLLEVPPAKLNETFLHWFSHIQAQLLKDLAHAEYNGTELLSELSSYHKKYTELLIPTVFTSTLHVLDAFDEGLFKHSFLKIAYQKDITSQVWLDCQVSEVNGVLTLSWDYVNELFFSDVINEMFSSLVALVKWLAKEDWNTYIPNLIQKKTIRLIEKCNNQKIFVPSIGLYEGLLTGVKDRPNQIALVNGQTSFSYKNLYQLASFIYFFLQDKKFKIGQTVVVIGDKVWEQIPIILGVLLAGGIYVPVASCWPKKRIQNILSQAEPSLIFLDDKTLNIFSKTEIKENFYSSTKIFNTFKTRGKKLVPVKDTALLAYIIYTSGSTGDPKGVAISHRAALNTITEINRLFSITNRDCVLALSEISFDLSVYDIFGLLLANGKIVLPTVEELKNPESWIQLIFANDITIWNSTPAFMQMLIDYIKATKSLTRINSIRIILLSGDWIPIPLVREIQFIFPYANIISLGGATEASIWSIYYQIKRINPLWKSIPYGKALSNQGVVVLNEVLDPCPMRVTGDIYIYGEGLAVQYWKNVEKTAERFIVHPRTGLRLYKTGDMGRLLPTGDIELLGRKDNQIKRLGQRIELSEIENVIKKFKGVEDAIVIYIRKFNKIIAYAKLAHVRSGHKKSFKGDSRQINNRIKNIADSYFLKTPQKGLNQFRKGLVILNKLALFAIAKVVSEVAVTLKIKPGFLVEELIFQIPLRYQKLFKAWLLLLNQHKLLEIKKEKIFFKNQDFYQKRFSKSLRQSSLYIEKNKELRFLLHYLSASIHNHKDILKSKINPLAILFPDGNFEMAESAHQHNPLDSYYNKLASSVLEVIVNGRAKNGCEILELGAGVGGFTVHVAPILQRIENVSYKYTDVSSHFIINAKNKFRSFNFIEYGLYNIDLSPEEQGYKINSYDILVAGNCLHDAKNIEQALKNLNRLLVPGGYLIMIEGTQTNPTYLASYGFLNDYDDERELENFPFLNKTSWVHLLKLTGFQNCFVFDEKGNTKDDFSYSVIVAQADSSYKEDNEQSALKSFLKEHLPAPMIPDELLVVQSLPVTDNGKINRKLLEEREQCYTDNEIANNKSKLEDLVSLIFKQVLGDKRIKPTDNFFDCGGDSLSMIKLFALLRSQVDSSLTISELVKNPTIREVANLCEDKKKYVL
ncbi:MAG: hypothetical protein K0R49_634, partial [Burkholderiales bacterium]|nr:hypothetical protein [Burkholderiales bacterium]